MELNLVVLAYNRLGALERLLASLEKAERVCSVNLTISCDGGASEDVLSFCRAYEWEQGAYNCIEQSVNLGVDQHNLACIDLALNADHVVVLEDDLSVSPYYMYYLKSCLEGIEDFSKVAAISLYRYTRVDSTHFPFELIPNAEDVYYMQRPSSKGCLYTKETAQTYKSFRERFDYNFQEWHLPPNVLKWSDEIWEKNFYCFLVDSDKFLAFPRYSLSTDHGDRGVHMQHPVELFKHQSALYLDKVFNVSALHVASNVYDAFYELEPSRLLRFCEDLSGYDLELDLYGTKELKYITKPYVLSERFSAAPIRQWDRRFKPEINNVLLNLPGEFYTLAKTNTFRDKTRYKKIRDNFFYYFPDTKLTDLLKMKWSEVKSRF